MKYATPIQFVTFTTILSLCIWSTGMYTSVKAQESAQSAPETSLDATSSQPSPLVPDGEKQIETSVSLEPPQQASSTPIESEIKFDISDKGATTTTHTVTNLLIEPVQKPPLAERSTEIDVAIANMREHIESNHLPSLFLERLSQFEKARALSSSTEATPTKAIYAEIPETGNSKAPFAVLGGSDTINKKTIDAKKKNINSLQSFSDDVARASFGTSTTPYNLAITAPTALSTIVDDTNTPPTGYSMLANEVSGNQLIKDWATKLNHDPLTILNFVRENIIYEPYYGSKKGAASTLLEGTGNDADQAALLIALLRASDVPARYHHGVVQLSLRTVIDLLGVDNAELAARILGGANIPYTLYYENNMPAYFGIELFWVEAYIEHGPYMGVTEAGVTEKTWTPLVPGLVPTYAFQTIDAVEGITSEGFSVQTFYDEYLKGSYGTSTPINAFENIIATYVSSQEKTLEDAQISMYRGYNALEFIPATLPFSIITDYGTYAYMPKALRHEIEIRVASSTQELLTYRTYTNDIANRELLVSYTPATEADAAFLASFNSLYEVTPLSLLTLKPRLTVGGQEVAVGSSGNGFMAGLKATLGLSFYAPKRGITGSITTTETEHVEKPTIVGNTEAIALDTGNIMPPEIRPSEDVQTVSAAPDQKLYRTALNYLDRLEDSHDILAQYTGGSFTDIATRAIVSNSLGVTTVAGQPYSFTWTGLAIDASGLVRYHARFGSDVHHNQPIFTYIFGLQASLDEARIFEDEYQVDAVSTVKGLQLINTHVVPGSVVKITESNASIIDTLSISTKLKNTLYDAIADGRIVYVPSAPFTYGLWSGMIYITLDPITGSGSYVIGEGLNGGYTAEPFFKDAEEFFTKKKNFQLQASLSVSNSTPVRNNTSFIYEIKYFLKNLTTGASTIVYTAENVVDTRYVPSGTYVIKPNNNAVLQNIENSVVTVGSECIFGKTHCEYDKIIKKYADQYGIPGGIIKAIIHKETNIGSEYLFKPEQYRYEPSRDYRDYSGRDPIIDINTKVPYKNFAIKGQRADGDIVSTENKLSKMSPDYVSVTKTRSAGGWGFRSLIGYTGNQTFADLLELDKTVKGSQRWIEITNETDPIRDSSNRNFTAQTVLSASYGIMQVMYLEATNIENSKILTDGDNPFSISKNVDLGIHLGTAILKDKSTIPTTDSSDLARCDGWGGAVRRYNGSPSYRNEVCDTLYKLYK